MAIVVGVAMLSVVQQAAALLTGRRRWQALRSCAAQSATKAGAQPAHVRGYSCVSHRMTSYQRHNTLTPLPALCTTFTVQKNKVLQHTAQRSPDLLWIHGWRLWGDQVKLQRRTFCNISRLYLTTGQCMLDHKLYCKLCAAPTQPLPKHYSPTSECCSPATERRRSHATV